MGYIREPEGVDFVIAPSPNTEKDIAYQHLHSGKQGENKGKQGKNIRKTET
jgi:hypothetical protein